MGKFTAHGKVTQNSEVKTPAEIFFREKVLTSMLQETNDISMRAQWQVNTKPTSYYDLISILYNFSLYMYTYSVYIQKYVCKYIYFYSDQACRE